LALLLLVTTASRERLHLIMPIFSRSKKIHHHQLSSNHSLHFIVYISCMYQTLHDNPHKQSKPSQDVDLRL
jgi:hypothetical protein